MTEPPTVDNDSGWLNTARDKERNRQRRTVGQHSAIVEQRGDGHYDWYVRIGHRVIRWGECDDRDEARRRAARALATEIGGAS